MTVQEVGQRFTLLTEAEYGDGTVFKKGTKGTIKGRFQYTKSVLGCYYVLYDGDDCEHRRANPKDLNISDGQPTNGSIRSIRKEL